MLYNYLIYLIFSSKKITLYPLYNAEYIHLSNISFYVGICLQKLDKAENMPYNGNEKLSIK